MAVMDGVDEVHKVTVANNVLKGYWPHDGLWHHLLAKRAAARKKFEPLLASTRPQAVRRRDKGLWRQRRG